MALINCLECDHTVSDKAVSCPNCGAPINSSKGRVDEALETITVQGTARRFKLQKVISISLIIIGFLGMVSGNQSAGSEVDSIWVLLVLMGSAWYVVNRIRIWWHHK